MHIMSSIMTCALLLSKYLANNSLLLRCYYTFKFRPYSQPAVSCFLCAQVTSSSDVVSRFIKRVEKLQYYNTNCHILTALSSPTLTSKCPKLSALFHLTQLTSPSCASSLQYSLTSPPPSLSCATRVITMLLSPPPLARYPCDPLQSMLQYLYTRIIH
jgi:hypothetical protein